MMQVTQRVGFWERDRHGAHDSHLGAFTGHTSWGKRQKGRLKTREKAACDVG